VRDGVFGRKLEKLVDFVGGTFGGEISWQMKRKRE
jgi:hypothetical protein